MRTTHSIQKLISLVSFGLPILLTATGVFQTLRFLCFVATLSALTAQVSAATVSWVGGSGDWDTPSNWSTATLPGPNDDVVIDRPGDITVTHSSGTHSVKSLQSQEAFFLSGGSLTVSNTVQVNNIFTLAGGTLVRATVLQGTNGLGITVSSGILDGVTVNGDLDLINNATPRCSTGWS